MVGKKVVVAVGGGRKGRSSRSNQRMQLSMLSVVPHISDEGP